MIQKKRLAGILVGAVLLIAFAAGAALAAPDQQAKANKANLYQDFIAKLSSNLGVEQGKVESALKDTRKQMLDEAVQKGYLTRQQAGKIGERDGNFGWFAGVQANQHKFTERKRNQSDKMAKALGITPEQLGTELKSGKKLPQIMADHGISQDQFRQKMFEIKKEALEKAVSESKMTRDQADKIIQKMKQRLNSPAPGAAN